VLFFTGLVVLMVKVSDNWWELGTMAGLSYPFALLPVIIGTFWLIPKTKNLYIKIYASKRSPGSGYQLSTKLLASEK
jgi:hypothetical protein